MSEHIRFGPSGISEPFYQQGFKHSYQMPAWLRSMGLSAYEYSFGRGINIGEEKARLLGEQVASHDVAMSVHAPYYINLCSPGEEQRAKSRNYIIRSVRTARQMGATRVVFHPGSVAGMDRAEALRLTMGEVERLLAELSDAPDMLLCPETMGKLNQQGTVDEILQICSIDRQRLLPAVDFGHINALTQGSLKTAEDFRRIVDAIEGTLGTQAARRFHIHFSHIEYGKSGEVRHLTFEDTVYGPFFEPLAQVLSERNLAPVVICESKDRMAEDALRMKSIYEEACDNRSSQRVEEE